MNDDQPNFQKIRRRTKKKGMPKLTPLYAIRCRGKHCYTKQKALNARSVLTKRHPNEPLWIYKCPFGSHWHLTHKPPRKGDSKKL